MFFYSEDGEERRTKKISVAIRPLTPNRGVSVDNVDDIRNVALNLRLSPAASVSDISAVVCSLLLQAKQTSSFSGVNSVYICVDGR